MLKIKKHKSRNEYINSGEVWVRNYTKKGVPPLNINNMFHRDEYSNIIKNEFKNETQNYKKIADENFKFDKVVIISDGYDFENTHKIISKFPKDVIVIAVNRALKKWDLLKGEEKRAINIYVTNNPNKECLSCLPKGYFPVCIASSRTNPEFLERYRGNIYLYEPAEELDFGKDKNEKYSIDDYRNPICAAIGLSYQFGVKKLMLMCCDDSSEFERETSLKLKNGLWTYPQHIKSHNIIDANLYWLSNQEIYDVEISSHSSGPEFINADYITKEEAIEFFKEESTEEEAT